MFSHSYSFFHSLDPSLSLSGRCLFLFLFNFLHSLSHNESLSLFSHSPCSSSISPPCHHSSSPSTTPTTTIIHNSTKPFSSLDFLLHFSSTTTSTIAVTKYHRFFSLSPSPFQPHTPTFFLQSLSPYPSFSNSLSPPQF